MFSRLLVLSSLAGVGALIAADAYAQTVEDAIAAALRHNPQIEVGEADTALAEADRFGAFGRMLPSVSASISASSEDWRSNELNRLQAEDGLTYSLEFSQPIFQGGSALYGLRDADSSLQAQKFFESESRQLVAQSAATAHAALTLDRAIVRHRTRSLDLLIQQVDFTDRRREAGAESLIAVSQARSRMEQEKAELVRAEARLAASEAAYARQTGRPAEPQIIPDDMRIEDEIGSLAEAISMALASNPRLRASDALVTAAEHGRRSARGELGPKLSLDGQYQVYDLDESAFLSSAGREANEFQLVARLRIPLFQQGQNYSGLQSARVRVAREQAVRREARLALEEAVTANWTALLAVAAAIDAAQASVEASEIVVEGQQAEYRSGSANIRDVLDGQRDLVFARISLSQAEFDYRRARYELLATMDRLAPSID
ncbi:MAG: TolC family protein [Pseudomonadota bacterium]